MLKQTKEFFIFIAALVGGTVQSLADGKFGFADIINYIRAFSTGQEGIEGAGEIPAELIAAQPEQKRDVFAELESQLIASGMDQNDAYDTAQIFSGAGSAIAFGSRLTNREKNEQFAKLLNSGAVTVNGPMVISETVWTGADVEKLLESYEDLL